MDQTPDYILDIPGLQAAADDGARGPAAKGDGSRGLTGRPWLAVFWRCCHVYCRIYRNHDGTAYQGRCPKCQRHVRAAIGPGGTDCRLFLAE